jgi:hypothetical protein
MAWVIALFDNDPIALEASVVLNNLSTFHKMLLDFLPLDCFVLTQSDIAPGSDT